MVQWSVAATGAAGVTWRLHRSACVSRVSRDVCDPSPEAHGLPRRETLYATPAKWGKTSEKRQRIRAGGIITLPDAKRA